MKSRFRFANGAESWVYMVSLLFTLQRINAISLNFHHILSWYFCEVLTMYSFESMHWQTSLQRVERWQCIFSAMYFRMMYVRDCKWIWNTTLNHILWCLRIYFIKPDFNRCGWFYTFVNLKGGILNLLCSSFVKVWREIIIDLSNTSALKSQYDTTDCPLRFW